jgi:predicted DCC family thiol-disulfide oxidoreductase YuxK
MNNPVAASFNLDNSLIIVVDDTCPVVHKLGWLVRQWDKQKTFRFIGQSNSDASSTQLLEKLSETPWSLMLIDQQGNSWLGPEAIPFILKNLPSGKIAAVTYTVPGTMWLTRKLYHMISCNRRLLAKSPNGNELKTA